VNTWIRRNPLQVLLWIMVGIAIWHPQWGHSGARWHPEWLVTVLVSVMFFMHGLALPTKELINGIKEWPIHSLIQGCTYILFPLLGLGLIHYGTSLLDPAICLGFFLLCTTSSTVASCIALTAKSHGRVAVALFNASLSSVIGVVLTPLLVSLVATQSGIALSWPNAFAQIALHILLPLVAGQAVRLLWSSVAYYLSQLTTVIDYASIGLVVLNALSDSIISGAFSHSSLTILASITVTAVILFWLVIGLLKIACRYLKLSAADEIAVLYCGSQKSISNGLPIAKILFQGLSSFGIIILPLVVYHQCQLLFSAFLSDHYVRNYNKQLGQSTSH